MQIILVVFGSQICKRLPWAVWSLRASKPGDVRGVLKSFQFCYRVKSSMGNNLYVSHMHACMHA